MMIAGALVVGGAVETRQSVLPPAFDRYLAGGVRLTAADQRTLAAGRPVTILLESDPGKEVAVFGAIWIAATREAYVQRVREIENFEKGGAFRVTRRISDPPRLEDFRELTLPRSDLEDLRKCGIGDCEVKLDAGAIQALRAGVDWKSPSAHHDANGLFRRVVLDYVNGYREGGNERLPVYRDTDRPTFVAAEFRSMIENLPPLTALPDLRRYLLEYPAATLPGSTDVLYWQEVQFGLKPTIRINHLTIQDCPDATIVASKMLYATHYFRTALELRVLLPDASRGPGFWLITLSRSRPDGLSGFVGRIIRGRVRNETRKGTLSALTTTKTRLEGPPR